MGFASNSLRLFDLDQVSCRRYGFSLQGTEIPLDVVKEMVGLPKESAGLFSVSSEPSLLYEFSISGTFFQFQTRTSSSIEFQDEILPSDPQLSSPTLLQHVADACKLWIMHHEPSLHVHVFFYLSTENSIHARISCKALCRKHKVLGTANSLFHSVQHTLDMDHVQPECMMKSAEENASSILAKPFPDLEIPNNLSAHCFTKLEPSRRITRRFSSPLKTCGISLPPLEHLNRKIVPSRKRTYYFPMVSPASASATSTLFSKKAAYDSPLAIVGSSASASSAENNSNEFVGDQEVIADQVQEETHTLHEQHSASLMGIFAYIQLFARDFFALSKMMGLKIRPAHKYARTSSQIDNSHALDLSKLEHVLSTCSTLGEMFQQSPAPFPNMLDFPPKDTQDGPIVKMKEPWIVAGFDGDLRKFPLLTLNVWDKACIEPVHGPAELRYISILPQRTTSSDKYLASRFFRNLGSLFQTCNLGTHFPFADSEIMEKGILQLSEAGPNKSDSDSYCREIISQISRAIEFDSIDSADNNSKNSRCIVYIVMDGESCTDHHWLVSLCSRVSSLFQDDSSKGKYLHSERFPISFQIVPLNVVTGSTHVLGIPMNVAMKNLAFSVYRKSSQHGTNWASTSRDSVSIASFRPFCTFSLKSQITFPQSPKELKGENSDTRVSSVHLSYRIVSVPSNSSLKVMFPEIQDAKEIAVVSAMDSDGEHLQSCLLPIGSEEEQLSVITRLWKGSVSRLLSDWRQTVDEFILHVIVCKLGEMSAEETSAWDVFLCSRLSNGTWDSVSKSTEDSFQKSSDKWDFEEDFICLSSAYVCSSPDYCHSDIIPTSIGQAIQGVIPGDFPFLSVQENVWDESTQALYRGSILLPRCFSSDGQSIDDCRVEMYLHSVCSLANPSNVQAIAPSFRTICEELYSLVFVNVDGCFSSKRYPYHFTLTDRMCDLLSLFHT